MDRTVGAAVEVVGGIDFYEGRDYFQFQILCRHSMTPFHPYIGWSGFMEIHWMEWSHGECDAVMMFRWTEQWEEQ